MIERLHSRMWVDASGVIVVDVGVCVRGYNNGVIK